MRRVPASALRAPAYPVISRRLAGFGDALDTARGTTQSYVSSEICNINKIKEANPGNLDVQWRTYCDCMFLEYRLIDTYYVDGVEIVKPAALPDSAWIPYVDSIGRGATAQGKKFSILVEKRPIYSEPWQRCVARYCASPGGCMQADGRVDPFNMNPGMLADPWTEVGAGVRGIAVRYANNDLMDLAKFTAISAADYDPIALWATLWGNPAKYTLLILKAQFIPFLGAYVLGIANPTGLIPMVADAIQTRPFLWPNGNVDLARDKYMLRPMLEGGKNFFGLVLKYLGKCGIGFNIPCGAGVVIQQMCIDQIRDKDANGISEFDRISSPTTQAVVLFLSRHGEELVQKAVNLLSGLKDGTILLWLEMVFREILNDSLIQPYLKPDVRFALKLLAMGAGIAGTVWTGYQNKWPFLTIVDDIVFKLLGFRPSLIKSQLAGAQLMAAKSTLTAGVSQTGVTLVEAAGFMKVAASSLEALVHVVQDINNNIGGGLEELIGNIRGAIDGTNQATEESAKVIAEVEHAVTAATNPPATQIAASRPITGGVAIAKPAVVVPKVKVSTDAPKPSGNAALIGLAAGGFVAAGPVGALIGAGAGLWLNRNSGVASGTSGTALKGMGFAGYDAITDLSTGRPRVSSIQSPASSGEQLISRAKEVTATFYEPVREAADQLFTDSVSTMRDPPKRNAVLLAAGLAGLAVWAMRRPTTTTRLSSYSRRSHRRKIK